MSTVESTKVIFESKILAEDVIDQASFIDDDEMILTPELCEELESQLSDAVMRVLESFIDDYFEQR